MKTVNFLVEYIGFAAALLIVLHVLFGLVPENRVHVYETSLSQQQVAVANCMASYLTEGEMKDGIVREAEAVCRARQDRQH